MKYDVLIVGCGLTACTIAAAIDPRKTICIVDTRAHIGGNIFDHDIGATTVHAYGPHIFHSPDRAPVEFLSKFTAWRPYDHFVEAEVADPRDDYNTKVVPFPYSAETAAALGRELNPDEIIEMFFEGYSFKMWGMPYGILPGAVKGRVPKQVGEKSSYFPGQFVAMPEEGYTPMARRMLERANVEVRLGVHPQAWKLIDAGVVVYCGRPDLVDDDLPRLPWRSVDFTHNPFGMMVGTTSRHAPVRNFCHAGVEFTRVTDMAALTSSADSYLVAETPREGGRDEIAPFYPDVAIARRGQAAEVVREVKSRYPNLVLAGRLGRFAYIDMHAAVSAALNLAEKL